MGLSSNSGGDAMAYSRELIKETLGSQIEVASNASLSTGRERESREDCHLTHSLLEVESALENSTTYGLIDI